DQVDDSEYISSHSEVRRCRLPWRLLYTQVQACNNRLATAAYDLSFYAPVGRNAAIQRRHRIVHFLDRSLVLAHLRDKLRGERRLRPLIRDNGLLVSGNPGAAVV